MLKSVRPHHRSGKHLRAACVLLVVLFGCNLAAAAVPPMVCGGGVCCGNCGPTSSGPVSLKEVAPGGCCPGSQNSACAGAPGPSTERADQPASLCFSAKPDPSSPSLFAVKTVSGNRLAMAQSRPQTSPPGIFHSRTLFMALGILKR